MTERKQEEDRQGSTPGTRWGSRRLAWLRPSHQHTAFSATLLLMLSAFLSRIIGLVREKFIAYLFGAGTPGTGPETGATAAGQNHGAKIDIVRH